MPDQEIAAPAEDAAETTTPEAKVEAAENPEQTKPTETVEFWKAKAREQEKRAKENAAKAAEFDKVTDAQKSEQQRLIERAEAAENEAKALRAANEIASWKTQITSDPKYAGVSADVLRGSTFEELEDHAASVKALLPEPRKPGSVPGEGRTVTTGTGDPAQQFAELLRGARRG
jgi:hypothetical protein